jgi:hypothetical protein
VHLVGFHYKNKPVQYPFYIRKVLDSIARKLGNSFWVGNGTLLVEDYDATQAEKLLKLLSWDPSQ